MRVVAPTGRNTTVRTVIPRIARSRTRVCACVRMCTHALTHAARTQTRAHTQVVRGGEVVEAVRAVMDVMDDEVQPII